MNELAHRTLKPFALYRIETGHYAVHERDSHLLIGDVVRVEKGEDAGLWRGMVWDAKKEQWTGRSAAAFCCRWEAVGFLARQRERQEATPA